MKKKLYIIFGILITLIGISAACIAVTMINEPKHPSDYHIGITLDEALQADKPILALFYADWCGYCLRFMPKYQLYNKLYGDKYSFVMINVEGDAQSQKLTEETGITSYPTLYILDPKYDNKVLIASIYYSDLAKFRVELERYLRIRALLDKSNSCK